MSGRNSARRLRRHAAQRLAQRVDPQAEPRRLRPKLGEFAYVILARRPASDLREDLAAYLLGRLSNAGPRTRTTVPARGRRPSTSPDVEGRNRSAAMVSEFSLSRRPDHAPLTSSFGPRRSRRPSSHRKWCKALICNYR